MGALCCCLRVPDETNNADSSNSCPGDCLCPKCFFQKLFNKPRTMFTRRQTHAIKAPSDQPSSSDSEVVFRSLTEVMASQYDGPTNTPNIRQQGNEAPRRLEKGSSGSRVQPEPVRQSDIRINPKSIQEDQSIVSKSKTRSQKQNPESSEKVLPTGDECGNLHKSRSPDEEECPTCLEEYTKENPKIIATCHHHFHLSCIYEWMERSTNCPVCSKMMKFDEAI